MNLAATEKSLHDKFETLYKDLERKEQADGKDLQKYQAQAKEAESDSVWPSAPLFRGRTPCSPISLPFLLLLFIIHAPPARNAPRKKRPS